MSPKCSGGTEQRDGAQLGTVVHRHGVGEQQNIDPHPFSRVIYNFCVVNISLKLSGVTEQAHGALLVPVAHQRDVRGCQRVI